MRTLLLALVLATTGTAAASPFALHIDSMPASAPVGAGLDIRVRITNTDTVARRVETGCGSESQFVSSDAEIPIQLYPETKCVGASTVLAAGHSLTRIVELGILGTATLGRHDVALTFTAAGTRDAATSPPRTIELVARSHR